MTRVVAGLVLAVIIVVVSAVRLSEPPRAVPEEPRDTSRPIAVWVDTDVAAGLPDRDVGDALALLQAFNSPELSIRGVSVVSGNTSVRAALPIAQRMVRRFGPAGLEVYEGAAGPDLTAATPAADALSAALRVEPLTILALGPLTNVAAVLTREPALASRIRGVVAVGGRRAGQRFTTGTTNPRGHRDFNFEMDPEAFAVLLAHQVPLALAPFELSSRVWITAGDLDRLEAGNESARWLADVARGWLALWGKVFDVGGFNPFDTLAVAYLTHPDMLQCTVQPIVIETEGDDHTEPRMQGTFVAAKPHLVVGPARRTHRTATYCYDVKPWFKEVLLERLGAAAVPMGSGSAPGRR